MVAFSNLSVINQNLTGFLFVTPEMQSADSQGYLQYRPCDKDRGNE